VTLARPDIAEKLMSNDDVLSEAAEVVGELPVVGADEVPVVVGGVVVLLDELQAVPTIPSAAISERPPARVVARFLSTDTPPQNQRYGPTFGQGNLKFPMVSLPLTCGWKQGPKTLIGVTHSAGP
jgi:hypothetical protein